MRVLDILIGFLIAVSVVLVGLIFFEGFSHDSGRSNEAYRICRDGTVVWKRPDGTFYIGFGAPVSDPDKVCAQ